MGFFITDISLLIAFALFVAIFLSKNKKNLGKEGSMILYRTQWGVKFIDKIGNKYKKTLKTLSYFSIFVGGILMVSMIYLITRSVWNYITTSISEMINAPPIMPLIPYFPQLFGLESFFPPFYFTYFILAIVIVATVHEFAHGIFARRYGIKIKSTGFAFWKYFPAFFGAFVEQDEKQMNKGSKFEQMSILSAGVFANVLTAVVFGLLMILLFSQAFSASGVQISNYAFDVINASEIQKIENIGGEGFIEIKTENTNYLLTPELLEKQQDRELLIVFYNSPLIKNKIQGTIKKINGEEIKDIWKLREELEKYSSGDKILLTTKKSGIEKENEIILGEHPENSSQAFLGFNTYSRPDNFMLSMMFAYRLQDIYETANEFNWFVYYLFWWIIVINLLVALFNMLPLGILDGGRFFYLGIWAITKNEKIGKKLFVFATYFLLFLLAVMMSKWIFRFF